jgi:hypothetical protein
MQKSQVMLIVVLVAISSCSRTSKTSPHTVADGLSFATAVAINEKSESKGVRAEYIWIKEHYSTYKVMGQSLISHNKKNFDTILIKFSDDRELTLFFDISKFYGKP